MHTLDSSRHADNACITEAHVDDLIKIIRRQHTPPFDLIACEILDSVLQHATAEQIAQFSQVHVDTVRRAFQQIESILDSPSHSQIIDNCQLRLWSVSIASTKRINLTHLHD